jgi:hypothetical protein
MATCRAASQYGHRRDLFRAHRGAVPYPHVNPDLILFGKRRHTAPRARLAEVAKLRHEQLGQPLVLQHRPGRKPGQDPRREHIQPDQVVIERDANSREHKNIRGRDAGENGNPADRKGRGQAEVIELVEPFLDPPDIRIRWQVHLNALLLLGRSSTVTGVSGLQAHSRFPWPMSARCSACRRQPQSRRRAR